MDELRTTVVPDAPSSWSSRRSRVVGPVLLALLMSAGCDRVDARVERGTRSPADPAGEDSVARVRQDSVNRAQPGYIVDSILPLDEALRRFRAELPGPAPVALTGGARSRDALVREFVRALETRDSAALGALALTPQEFAWLVYPSSPYVAPPWRQMPGLVWTRIALGSASGRARLLARLAGRPLGYADHSCRGEPEHQGRNRIWRDCAVRLTQPGGADRTMRLFGDVIERAGHFKFVSFANDL